MSIRITRLATALVAQLSIFMPHFAMAGHTRFEEGSKGITHFKNSTQKTQTGVPLVIRANVDVTDSSDSNGRSSAGYGEHHDTWADFEDRGYKHAEHKHNYRTLAPDVDVRSFAEMHPDLVSEGRTRLMKKREFEGVDDYYAELFIEHGIPKKRKFLTAPPEFDTKDYWDRNKTIIAMEYPTLPDIESEDWQTPSTDVILSWDWEEKADRLEIEMASLRHAYNLGIFDHIHHENGNPELDVVHERSALAWMPFPEDYNWDWRNFLSWNPRVKEQMEHAIGSDALEPKKAIWTQIYAFRHGFDNSLLIEGLPEGFSWRTYYYMLEGLDKQQEKAWGLVHSESLKVTEESTSSKSLNYHFNELPAYPAEQDLDYKDTQADMFALALATQRHFVKHAEELGLLYPFLPTSFDAMKHLSDSDTNRRFKAVGDHKTWSDLRKIGWTEADFWLQLNKFHKKKTSGETDVEEPQGFILPKGWTVENHVDLNWGADDELQEQFANDPYKEVKVAAWMQEAVSRSMAVEAPLEEDIIESSSHLPSAPRLVSFAEDEDRGLTRFAEVPNWFDADLYLELNPEQDERIARELRSEWDFDSLTLGEQRLLKTAAEQVNFVENRGRHNLVPNSFMGKAREYFRLNRGKIKIPSYIRTNEDKEMYLEHHYATVGMAEGLLYTQLQPGLVLPEWANEEFYFSQSRDLQQMANTARDPEARSVLMRQHYFSEGIKQGLSLVQAPIMSSIMSESDADEYFEQAPELLEMVEKAGGVNGKAKIHLASQHHIQVGQARGLKLHNVRVFQAADMTPEDGGIGYVEGHGLVHVFEGSEDGLITTSPKVRLEKGDYQIELIIDSPASKGTKIGNWNIRFDGQSESFATQELHASSGKVLKYSTAISVTGKEAPLVVDTYGEGGTELYIHAVRIRPLPSDSH
jgi:hypothetical protein